MGKSIIQDWVTELGLRHQGCLLGAIRGCDAVNKEDPSKRIIRALRSEILNAFIGDPRKCSSFIEVVEEDELIELINRFCKDFDHYPNHFVMHLMHAAEIIGYHHPQMDTASVWSHLYKTLCRKMHVTPETKFELDARLDASEEVFKAAQ